MAEKGRKMKIIKNSAGLDIILADITHVKYYLGFEL